MKTKEAVNALDAINPEDDPERAHSEADEILLAAVAPEVADAYRRLVTRAPWWAAS